MLIAYSSETLNFKKLSNDIEMNWEFDDRKTTINTLSIDKKL